MVITLTPLAHCPLMVSSLAHLVAKAFKSFKLKCTAKPFHWAFHNIKALKALVGVVLTASSFSEYFKAEILRY